jgi:Uma2 family endonuclease
MSAMRRATARSDIATWEDFVRLPDDDRRELIDGLLVEVEVPAPWHEDMVAELLTRIRPWARRRGMRALASGCRVRITERRGVMPDVQVLSQETYDRADPGGLAGGRPEIAIEIISPRSRGIDRVSKLQWYGSIGVPEYWIVDPERRSVEQLVLRDGTYAPARVVEGDVDFRPVGRKGLVIPLAELWKALPRARRLKAARR